MTRRRLLLALVMVLLLAVPQAARVVTPPPEIRLLSPPPPADAPPEAAETRPADVAWHREFRALAAEASRVCPAGDLQLLCEGPVCVLQGEPPTTLDWLEASLRRPLLPAEGLLGRLGVPTELLPCAHASRRIYGDGSRVVLAGSGGACHGFLAPDSPPRAAAVQAVERLCARFDPSRAE